MKEAVQLKLEDFLKDGEITNKTQRAITKSKNPKSTKQTIPQELQEIAFNLGHSANISFREWYKEIAKLFNCDLDCFSMKFKDANYYSPAEYISIDTNNQISVSKKSLRADLCKIIYDGKYQFELNLVTVIEDSAYSLKNTIITSQKVYSYRDDTCAQIQSITVGKWRKITKLLDTNKFNLLLSDKDVKDLLIKEHPYKVEVMEKTGIPAIYFFMAPQLEQLYKAGFSMIRHGSLISPSDIECFNRITQPGNNLKQIFKTQKSVYTVLKSCKDLKTWDVFRRIDNKTSISQDTLQQLYDGNWTARQMEELQRILGRRYKGNPIFTFDSLSQYLNRVNMYEAIDRDEALILLDDYLRACQVLEMPPKINGDSLKREHDVAARTLRYKKDPERAAKMKNTCKHLEVFNYEEDTFFIRGIQSYEDLVDEAVQQHNCVVSYADSIIEKKSYIYVMRAKNNPDKSLITVELDPKGTTIRQKLLAYNRPIRNSSQTEFLNRWLEHCKSIQKVKKAS